MIRKDIDPIALAETYQNGNPFPHIVIDNFLEDWLANKVADSLEQQNVQDWGHDPHVDQVNKWFMSDLKKLTPPVANTLYQFNEPETLNFFEKLTSINSLMPDPSYLGGGVHISGPGGRLGIHADFNLHPKNNQHRRLNALLFLNRNWDPSWKGQLQLWNSELTECVKSVEPIFNRLVVFSVTDQAFHGVPETIVCPANRRRISLALYYYTLDRPEHEKGPFHWASWKNPKI